MRFDDRRPARISRRRPAWLLRRRPAARTVCWLLGCRAGTPDQHPFTAASCRRSSPRRAARTVVTPMPTGWSALFEIRRSGSFRSWTSWATARPMSPHRCVLLPHEPADVKLRSFMTSPRQTSRIGCSTEASRRTGAATFARGLNARAYDLRCSPNSSAQSQARATGAPQSAVVEAHSPCGTAKKGRRSAPSSSRPAMATARASAPSAPRAPARRGGAARIFRRRLHRQAQRGPCRRPRAP